MMCALRRRAALALTLLFLAAVACVCAAPAAQAFPDLGCPPGVPDSKVAPAPQYPDRGVPGWFLPTPENPATGDPFAQGSDTSIYQAYGLAGLKFETYDLGCGGATANPLAAADTGIANLVLDGPLITTSLAAALADAAYAPTWLQVFDPVLENVASGMYDAIYSPLAPLLLLIAGALIIYASRRLQLGRALAAGLSVVVALGIVAVAAAAPVTLGRAADQVMTEASTGINAALSGRTPDSADPGAEAIAPFVDGVLYQRWLAGTLGSVDSEVALEYGDDLFRAHALTWGEAEQARQSPQRAAEITETKQQQWTETAEAIKERDADAYAYLTGARQNRTGEAAIALLAGAVLLFPVAAFLLMCAGYLLVRAIVMTAPGWATLALLPSMAGTLKAAASAGLAGVVNPIVAAVGATVTVNITGRLIAPDSGIPVWLGLVISILFCCLAWLVLKPFRRIASLATGNPIEFGFGGGGGGRAWQSGRGGLRELGSRALGSLVGNRVGNAGADDVDESLDPWSEGGGGAGGSLRPERFTRTEPVRSFDPVADPGTGIAPGPGPALNPAPVRPDPGVAAERAALPAVPITASADELDAREPPAAGPVPARAAATAPQVADARPTRGGASPVGEPEQVEPDTIRAPAEMPAPRVEPTVSVDGDEVYVIYTPDGGYEVDARPVAAGRTAHRGP